MRRRAFTMVEVLVAMAIFAMAAIVLGAAYVNVLNAYALANRAGTVNEELRFARAQLLAEADRDKAEEGAEFDTTAGGRVTWRCLIDTTDLPNLFLVRFTAELVDGTGGKPRVVEEEFRLLRPTWSEGTEAETLRADLRDRILEYQGKFKEGNQ